MVTLEQIKQGAARYVDEEFTGKLTGWQKWAVGAGAAMALGNLDASLSALREHPAVKALGVFDEAGNVDIDKIYTCLKTEAAKPENAEKADDFEALADLFARKDERREPKAEAAETPAQKDEVPPRAAENAEKSEKSLDELLDELAATLKSPSGSGADKSAETGYNKQLEARLEELKAGAPSDDAPDDKK